MKYWWERGWKYLRPVIKYYAVQSTLVLYHLGYLFNDFCLFFSPLEKSGGFFWSNVAINHTVHSSFFGIIPISFSKGRGNFQYCFLLSRGDVGAKQIRFYNQQTQCRAYGLTIKLVSLPVLSLGIGLFITIFQGKHCNKKKKIE